jgi:hypothetical protein
MSARHKENSKFIWELGMVHFATMGTTVEASVTIVVVAVSAGIFLLSKKVAAAPAPAKTATTTHSYPPALDYLTIPNSANIAAALNKHFACIGISNRKLPTSNSMYEIEEAFGAAANYWKDKVRDSHFEPRILYRSQVAEKLFQKMQETLLEDSIQGIMVKGPQGIGKSHSLVNFVLKLQATGDYLVTFIPDCDRWDTDVFILRMICDSFGAKLYGPNGIASLDLLAGSEPSSSVGRKEDLHMIIEAIAGEVAKMGKQWVFVFDQIDGLLQDRDASSISSLRYPFYLIRGVLEPGAISIISGSAMKGSNRSFVEFQHAKETTEGELATMFDSRAIQHVVKEAAGDNPHS